MSEPTKTELYWWIDRAREAEARVAELENSNPKWPPSWEKAPGWPPGWALEVCDFLKQTLEPPFGVSGRGSLMKASRLFTEAIALGIIPEPDCLPGNNWGVNWGGKVGRTPLWGMEITDCPPDESFPEQIAPDVCPREEDMTEMIPIVSSTIKSIGYDEETESMKSRLTVIFTSGTRYTYGGVPRELWRRFKDAKSAGQFFVREIKPVYDGVKI